MILDERNEFADATALGTSGTGRQLVGDVIDLGAVSGNLGEGEEVCVVISVDTAVTSAGAATVVEAGTKAWPANTACTSV